MSCDQDNKAKSMADADRRGGCCSSAAKEVVIDNPVAQSDKPRIDGCCKSAGNKESSVKAESDPDRGVKIKATGCCTAPTTKPETDGNGAGEKVGCRSGMVERPKSIPKNMDGCCSGVVECPEPASKKTNGCCSSVGKPAPDSDVGSKTKLDDCCASKSVKRTNSSVQHDNVDSFPSQDKIDDCCSSKEQAISSHQEIVPPCCEGIASNCCDDTCLDELAFRECEKDGCTEEAHETRSVAGLTRRKSTACDQHAKSIRQRWADKLATVGCLCRSLLAMNQKTCCTSNKQRPTRTKLIAMRGSAESLRTQVSCDRSVSSTIIQGPDSQIETPTGADTKACCSDKKAACSDKKASCSDKKASCSDKKASCTDKTACCTDKTSIACCDKEVYLDEALIISSARTKKLKTSCCAEKAVAPLAVNVEDPERGVSATEHVVLGISGMTCTGCETKLKRTLGSLAISNLKTSLVLGRADFDLDPTIMSAKDVVLHLQRTTEFKCTEMTSHGSEIHVIPDCEMKTFLRQDWPVGVTSMEMAGKSSVRISYDAKVIGARHLLQELQPSAKLAPYSGDSSLLAGSKHVRNIGFMTILSAVLTIPVLVLAWAPLSPKPVTYGSVSLALASVVQIVIAGPFYPNALKALIFTRIVEMDLLIVLSTSAAYVFSVVSFVYILRGRPLSTGEVFETSTLLVTLIMVGRYVSALARQKAVESVAMRSLQDSKAILVTEASDSEVEIDARLLHYDDVFKVMPDTRIVTDGLVISGVSEVNEAMMTGESKPVAKSSGSTVVAGSVNGSGTLLVRATHLPGENTISAIADMVDEAKLSKPKLQDIADKVASYFVPVIIALSIITFCIWIAIGIAVRRQSASEATVQAITYAITVLIVSCPCAIGLAVPMVVVIANGVAAERGVVFKSAHVVELGCKVTHVIFDKTGTLTTGEPAVVAQDYLLGDTETVRSQLLGLIVGIKHPVAVAVASHLVGNGVMAAQVTNVKSVAGKGVEATVGEDTPIRAGNSRWLDVESHPQVQHLLEQGHTVFCLEIGGTLSAIFGLRDEPRPEAITVVKTLQERGIAISIVSGDDEKAVAITASVLGISTFRAKCSPSDKRDFLQSITNHPTNSKKKSYTLFIGDGANDGPALAQATIGVHISPSSSTSDIASDAARAAADAVLFRPSLEGLLLLTDISKAAVKRIAFNFVWSFVYNLFAVLLAAGAFVDVRIPPEYAGLGEVVSVVPVVVVAIALKWVKF